MGVDKSELRNRTVILSVFDAPVVKVHVRWAVLEVVTRLLVMSAEESALKHRHSPSSGGTQ